MDLEALALAVDERICASASERRTARLFGVRLDSDDGPGSRVQLELLATGEARQIARMVRPPAGLAAIAIETGAWAAPMGPDLTMAARPSEHPDRRRVHVTLVVTGDEGADV